LRGEIKLRTRVIHVPEDVDVRALREKSGLSQSQFAERYGFNPRTIQIGNKVEPSPIAQSERI
jgi:DNA-binding transcriptional regulator YiaG